MGVFVLPTTTLREGSIYWNDLHHVISRWPGNDAQARPLNCPCCAEADRLHMLFVKMKGGRLSSRCDILHTKLPHYYMWNRRTWTLPCVAWVMYVSAVEGIRTDRGSSFYPHRSCHCPEGGRLFIKHESIVMLQNSEDRWSMQCRKHCCYGNKFCIIFCVFL